MNNKKFNPESYNTKDDNNKITAYFDEGEEMLEINDKIEVFLIDGRILEGRFVKRSEWIYGLELDGSSKSVETGFNVVGKIKGSNDTDSDWGLKSEQCLKISKV